MISKIIIEDINRLARNYMSDIDFFRETKELNFTPQNNIIIGPNGYGKSTLINILAEFMLCSKSEVTQFPGYLDFPKLWGFNGEFKDGVKIKADYSKVTFRMRLAQDMKSEESLESFSNFGKFGASINSSTGENTTIALNSLMNTMFGSNTNLKFPLNELKESLEKETDEDWKKRRSDLIKYYEENNIDSGQFTILLDEPDRNLDIYNLKEVYGMLSCIREDTQLISVIHNPVLIYKLKDLPGINIIEMKPGYLKEIVEVIETKEKWS